MYRPIPEFRPRSWLTLAGVTLLVPAALYILASHGTSNVSIMSIIDSHPLKWSTATECYLSILLFLKCVDLNELNTNGQSALWVAVHHNHLPAIRFLVEHGATISKEVLHRVASRDLGLIRTSREVISYFLSPNVHQSTWKEAGFGLSLLGHYNVFLDVYLISRIHQLGYNFKGHDDVLLIAVLNGKVDLVTTCCVRVLVIPMHDSPDPHPFVVTSLTETLLCTSLLDGLPWSHSHWPSYCANTEPIFMHSTKRGNTFGRVRIPFRYFAGGMRLPA